MRMMMISNCWDNGAKDKVNRLEGPPARSQGPKGPLTSSLSYLNFTCHIKHLTNLCFTELNRTEGQAGRLKLQQACHKTSEVSPTLTAVLRFCFNMSEVLLKLSLISSLLFPEPTSTGSSNRRQDNRGRFGQILHEHFDQWWTEEEEQ